MVQGITEFLPISSSAHLILLPKLLGWQDQGLAFDVAVHAGTLAAVLLFLRKEIHQIGTAWLRGWQSLSWDHAGQVGWLIVLATIPVGVAGLFAGVWIEGSLRNPMVIATSTGLFAILLWWSDRGAENNSSNLQNLNWQHAMVVGMAQAIALIPGTSRSGVTMTALLAMGYERVSAARFSFLMAVPVIALSAMLKLTELSVATVPVAWHSLLTGALVSAVTAFLCMRWFLLLVDKFGMTPFVVYRLLLAAGLWILFT